MPLEMNSCGKCSSCLAGGRVHGPYWYHYEWDPEKKVQHRRYGPGPGENPDPGAGVPAGTGKDGGLSYWDYAGDHAFGEEPLTEAEPLARRERLRKRLAAAERRLGRSLSAEEVSVIRRAEKDAAECEARLTPREGKQRQKVLDEQAELKKLQRRKNDAIRERTERPGMTVRLAAEAKKEIEAQFVYEVSEMKKQIKESRAEMKKMLAADG